MLKYSYHIVFLLLNMKTKKQYQFDIAQKLKGVSINYMSQNFINQMLSFTFNSSPSDIRVDSISNNVSLPPHQTIKLCPKDNETIRFAYSQGEGLIQIGENNSNKRPKNLLGEFLKYNSTDYNSLLNFFYQYGFLFKTKNDMFQKLELSTLTKIHNRLNALVELINNVNNIEKPNLKKIMELSMYLLFEDEWSLDLNTNDTKTSAKHSIKTLIDSAFDIHEKDRRLEIINKGTFKINDALYDEIEIQDSIYREIVNGHSTTPGYDEFRFREITYLYANYNFKDDMERDIIHLLYNFFYRIGIPKTISFDKVTYYSKYNSQAMDEYVFYDYVMDFAKTVIKTELEHHLKDIKPLYDSDGMQPRWNVESLLDALYFSIFYLDSKTQMYRQCKYCGTYFPVKRSNTTKIYCDGYCRGNAQQSRHRIKKKKTPIME